MFKATKRTLTAAAVIVAASGPSAAYARLDLNPSPRGVAIVLAQASAGPVVRSNPGQQTPPTAILARRTAYPSPAFLGARASAVHLAVYRRDPRVGRPWRAKRSRARAPARGRPGRVESRRSRPGIVRWRRDAVSGDDRNPLPGSRSWIDHNPLPRARS